MEYRMQLFGGKSNPKAVNSVSIVPVNGSTYSAGAASVGVPEGVGVAVLTIVTVSVGSYVLEGGGVAWPSTLTLTTGV